MGKPRVRRSAPVKRPSDDDVGYKKPPKHSQFKKGVSGNPNGRPKGTSNFDTDLQATLKAPVRVTTDGVTKKIPTQRATLFRLREMALKGNLKAIERLLAYAQIRHDEQSSSAQPNGLTDGDREILKSFLKRHFGPEESSTEDPET